VAARIAIRVAEKAARAAARAAQKAKKFAEREWQKAKARKAREDAKDKANAAKKKAEDARRAQERANNPDAYPDEEPTSDGECVVLTPPGEDWGLGDECPGFGSDGGPCVPLTPPGEDWGLGDECGTATEGEASEAPGATGEECVVLTPPGEDWGLGDECGTATDLSGEVNQDWDKQSDAEEYDKLNDPDAPTGADEIVDVKDYGLELRETSFQDDWDELYDAFQFPDLEDFEAGIRDEVESRVDIGAEIASFLTMGLSDLFDGGQKAQQREKEIRDRTRKRYRYFYASPEFKEQMESMNVAFKELHEGFGFEELKARNISWNNEQFIKRYMALSKLGFVPDGRGWQDTNKFYLPMDRNPVGEPYQLDYSLDLELELKQLQKEGKYPVYDVDNDDLSVLVQEEQLRKIQDELFEFFGFKKGTVGKEGESWFYYGSNHSRVAALEELFKRFISSQGVGRDQGNYKSWLGWRRMPIDRGEGKQPAIVKTGNGTYEDPEEVVMLVSKPKYGPDAGQWVPNGNEWRVAYEEVFTRGALEKKDMELMMRLEEEERIREERDNPDAERNTQFKAGQLLEKYGFEPVDSKDVEDAQVWRVPETDENKDEERPTGSKEELTSELIGIISQWVSRQPEKDDVYNNVTCESEDLNDNLQTIWDLLVFYTWRDEFEPRAEEDIPDLCNHNQPEVSDDSVVQDKINYEILIGELLERYGFKPEGDERIDIATVWEDPTGKKVNRDYFWTDIFPDQEYWIIDGEEARNKYSGEVLTKEDMEQGKLVKAVYDLLMDEPPPPVPEPEPEPEDIPKTEEQMQPKKLKRFAHISRKHRLHHSEHAPDENFIPAYPPKEEEPTKPDAVPPPQDANPMATLEDRAAYYKSQGSNTYLNFIRDNGFVPHTWNNFVKSLEREDLTYTEGSGASKPDPKSLHDFFGIPHRRPAPTEVMKNLWLGNKNDAGDEAFLKEHGIKTVFNCTPDVPDAPVGKTVRFPIHDSHDDEDVMRKNGMAWAQKIMEAMAEGPVLVHCVEGRQRSATLVALIMGLAGGKRLPAVIKELRAKRSISLMPEPTFKKPLEEWLS